MDLDSVHSDSHQLGWERQRGFDGQGYIVDLIPLCPVPLILQFQPSDSFNQCFMMAGNSGYKWSTWIHPSASQKNDKTMNGM